MHPRGLRCSSLKYSRYSRSSRLAGGAPRPSRCDARLSPRAVSTRTPGTLRTFSTLSTFLAPHHLMIEFTLPELGENITAGDVVRVLVKPGDAVTKDQAVLELETDKATIEVPSSVAGTVKDIKVKAGEKIKVGQTIFTVDNADADAGAGAAPAPAAEPAAATGPKPPPEAAPEEGGLSQDCLLYTSDAADE